MPSQDHEMDRPLTRSARRRKNERIKKAAIEALEKGLGPKPAYIIEWEEKIGPNIADIDERQLSPAERAPPHMVDNDEHPSINAQNVKALSNSASEARQERKNSDIDFLQKVYSNYWGKRGRAKAIASLETQAGRPISERTIRDYFAKTRN